MNKKELDNCNQAVLATDIHDMGLFDMIWNNFSSWQERSHTLKLVSTAGKRSIDIFGLKKESKCFADKLERAFDRIFDLEMILKEKERQEASVRIQLKRLQCQLDGMRNPIDAIDLT